MENKDKDSVSLSAEQNKPAETVDNDSSADEADDVNNVPSAGGDGGANADKKKNKKKNKKKKSKSAAAAAALGGEAVDPVAVLSAKVKSLSVDDWLAKLEKGRQEMRSKISISEPESEHGTHRFWDSQPVPKFDEDIALTHDSIGPLEEKTVDQVKVEPYPLPPTYEWVTVNIDKEDERNEVYTLLRDNYVEDDDAMFRFDYPIDFLNWALKPPGFVLDWHIGVRHTVNNSLVAFVSGVPAVIRVANKMMKMAEINFLCVHKTLRSKRLAPVLIKEVTRRVNLHNIWQAVYTAGARIPRPVGTARYWHRSLNPRKLIDVKFSGIPPMFSKFRDPISATVNHYKLPKEPQIPGIRPFEPRDVPQVRKKLNEYLSKSFIVSPVFTDEDVSHWMLGREGIVYSYVVPNPTTQAVEAFFSFYRLPSSILGHPNHSTLNVAYTFYYFTNEKIKLEELFKDGLILANEAKCDVFNALDIMDNRPLFEDLKFGIGDGNLHYYLYNYRCPEATPSMIGIVLL